MPSQLDLLPPEQAALLVKKKRFWKRTMWISLGMTALLLTTAIIYYSLIMDRIFQVVEELDNTEINARIESSLSEISKVVAIMRIAFALSACGILLFLTSLIRCLSLPKIPKA